MPEVNLFGDTGESWNDSISSTDSINIVPSISKTKKGLVFDRMPGTESFYETATASDEITGLFHVSGSVIQHRTYFMLYDGVTTDIYNITASGSTVTNIGTYKSAYAQNFSWAINYSEVGGTILVSQNGDNQYVKITLASNPASDTISVVSPALGTFGWINYFDGYFFAALNDSGNARKVISTDFGGTTFQALNFGLITSKSGSVIRVIDDNKEEWIFCDKHIEVWHNAGNAGFPLLRNSSVRIDVGLFAKYSLVKYSSTMIFVGVSETGEVGIYKTTGYQLEDITPEAIRDEMYSNQDAIATSVARPIILNNLSLYVFNTYDSGKETWIYNLRSGLWCKEASDSQNYSKYFEVFHTSGAIGINNNTSEGQLNLVVENISRSSLPQYENRIDRYTISKNVEVEDGTDPYKDFVMVSNYIVGSNNAMVVHDRLQIKFNPLSTTISIKVELSDDEGVSWDNYGTLDISNTDGLIDLHGLGASRKRLYRITSIMGAAYSGQITVTDAWLNVTELQH